MLYALFCLRFPILASLLASFRKKEFSFLNYYSTPSALSKLSKTPGAMKQQPGEKKETPQERLKRIMAKQLNKQSMACTTSVLQISHHHRSSSKPYAIFPEQLSFFLFFIFGILTRCILAFVLAVKKDTAVEMAKKKEQERQRLEKLAETSRLGRYRRRSRSRSYSRSRSPPRQFILHFL